VTAVIKLAGKLPPEADNNGLDAIAARLTAEPGKFHVLVMVVDCSKIELSTDTGERIPTARIRAIEAVADSAEAWQLVSRAREKRLGRQQLPFEMEGEIRAAFKDAETDD
jgi:hypothetical protein